jgi:hypothetical protein
VVVEYARQQRLLSRNASKCAGLNAAQIWPERTYSQSIPSSAIRVSSRTIDAVATSKSRRARDSPYRATSVAASTFMPVSTWPPLRELAPQPGCSRSMTVTDAPARASCRAAASPV